MSKENPAAARFIPTGRILVAISLGLGIIIACIVQIEAGQASVKVLFGKVQPLV